MKKHTRLLSLLLAFTLLFTGAFVVNAFASDGATDETDTNPDTEDAVSVGSYTQPAGSWTPTADYEGIVYGVWASEADFLAGTAPTKWYTDGEFTGARIGTTDNNGTTYADASFTPGYVHCFGDVTNNTAQIPTGQRQTLVINLAGHTLTNAKGFRIGGQSGVKTEAKVTFKNGTINHTGGQMQTRGNSSTVYDNIAYNYNGGAIFYDDGSHLYEFRNSVLTSTTNLCFDTGANANSSNPEINFINTDIICTKEQTLPMFRISTPAGPGVQNYSVNIFFDKDSSLTRSGVNLIALNNTWYDNASVDTDGDGVFGTFNVNQYVTFEVGFTFSTDSFPTTFDRTYYNKSTGKYSTVKSAETVDAGADNKLVVKVTKSGFDVNYLIVDADGEGMSTVIAAPSAGDVWNPATDTSNVDYTGITYGVWASELDYLLGKAPAKWYKDTNLLTANVGTTDSNGTVYADPDFIPGYVHVYADLNNTTAQIITGQTQKLVINLGGKTLTDSKGFRVGGSSSPHPNASLTIKNGVWNISDGQIQIRPDTTFIVEDVVMNLTSASSRPILYGCGGDYVKFKNCTINSKNGNTFAFTQNYANQGIARSQFIFENTDLIYETAPTAPLLALSEGAYGDAQYDFVFDKDSSITGFAGVFIQLKEGAGQLFTQKQTVTFEEGFSFNGGTEYPTEYEYIDESLATSTRVANDDLVYMNSASKIDPDVPDPDVPDPDVPNPDVPEYPIVAYDNDGNVIKQWKNAHIEDGTIDYVPSGGKIVLYADATIGTVHTNSGWNLTFDLNGHKLTFTTNTNMQLGYSMSGSWNERVITFTSSAEEKGTIDATIKSGYAFQARPGSIVIFENLDITFGGNAFNDGGAKSITFRNCNIEGKAGRWIGTTDGLGGGASGNERLYTFDNTVMKGMGIFSNALGVTDIITVTFKNGSVIDNSIEIMKTGISTRGDDKDGDRTVTLNIEANVSFTAPSLELITTKTANTAVTYNYYSDDGAAELGELITIDKMVYALLPEGGMLIGEAGKVDTAAYAYTVSTPGELSVMYPKKLGADGKAVLTCDTIMGLAANSVITFHTDLVYDPTGSTAGQGRVHGYKSGIVFDLNGNTFIFSGYRFQLEQSFTFKNGTVDCNGTTTVPFMGNPGDKANMVFDNVDLVISELGAGVFTVFNPYSGNIVFKGGSITAATNCNVFSLTNTAHHTLTLEGTKVNAGTLIATSYVEGMNDEYTITDCELTLTANVLIVNNSYSGTTDSIKLNITGSKLDVADLLVADGVTSPLANITVSETYFTAEPTVDETKGTLTFANGEKLAFIGGETYCFRVTALRIELKANILLESVFSVQFMIPENTNIISIKIGDTLYTVSEIEKTLVYNGATYKLVAVKGILPGEAAETIALEVVYTDGGVVHTVKAGYSVLNYVSTLLNTDYSHYVKKMAVAAVEYIAETYKYLGKTNADLTKLMASANYKANLPEAVTAVGGNTDFGNVGTVLELARLDLGATMKFRFAINSGYTGTVTVGGTVFEISNGKVGELGYVELELPAHELFDTVIEVTADGVYGTYCLADYASYVASSDATDADKALVAAFYTYCAYADAYADIAIN